MRGKTYELVICSMFIGFMAVGANVSPYLTIGGVPITLQLLFALLAGGILGSRLGAISMIGYMMIGLIGAPVFAQFKAGFGSLLSPTFGFILSFILVAYISGKIIEHSHTPTRLTFLLASFSGLLLNYLIGTNYMYMALRFWAEAPESFSYVMAWSWMLLYIPLDVVIVIFSALILPRLHTSLKHRVPIRIHTVK
ncbi:biotin transporter BioY [Metabacillus iocasae]|uniref:Biotin transporter n=1 Tax=Priestia iocasae TaxID=2291674 RepID=A0ABS2QRI8_9BACI|nr:biotin transporter BioY [Metabacillus iocasae]MBM7702020.1 biotin transport system substrate-specific component [Metabacillus iocasae]